jgi:two-component system, OmpR family, response regulator
MGIVSGADMSLAALIVEDDPRMAAHIETLLDGAGFETTVSHDGAEGLKLAAAGGYDLIVLDRMLPSLDGIAIVTRLRELDVTTPLLILSALSRVSQRVEGLEGGADDYLSKPFADEELLARARTLVRRRMKEAHPEVLLVGDIEIRVKARTVHRAGRHVPTSRKEFELVRCLAEHAGNYLPRSYLLEKVWNLHFDPQTNVVDVHVSRLRRKLDDGFERPSIHSARGEGYKFDPGL